MTNDTKWEELRQSEEMAYSRADPPLPVLA